MGSGNLDPDMFHEDLSRYIWGETTAIIPHTCHFSKRTIYPFQKAMRGIRKINGPAGETPVYLVKWAVSEEYTFAALKGKV